MSKMNIDNSNENKSKKKEDEHKQYKMFQVQTTPKGLFPLFKRTNDYFIYEKKFYCDLPKSIIPPKSFHYPYSLENFCQPDLLTMNFNLKKNNEILTDPKLNTLIHQDFINNSLETIFPNISKKKEDKITKEKLEKLKNEIINIVDRKEEDDKAKEKRKNSVLEKAFFLRKQIYLRPSLNVVKGFDSKKNLSNNKKVNDRQNKENIIKIIDKSFEDIKNVNTLMPHPNNKGVFAKNVFNVLPMESYPSAKFNEYMFPIDPLEEIKKSKMIEIPKKFLLIKNNFINNMNNNYEGNNNISNSNNDNSNIYSFYKNEKTVKDEIDNENNSNDNQFTAEYYSHEKDYTFDKAKEEEVFNRYLLFINRDEETVKFAPISDKFTLKKYKKFQSAFNNINNNNEMMEGEDEYQNTNSLLNNKRERDIIIIPKTIDEEGIKKRQKYQEDFNFIVDNDYKNVDNIDFSEIEKLKNAKEEVQEEQEEIDELFNDNSEENENNEINENDDDNENYEEDFDKSPENKVKTLKKRNKMKQEYDELGVDNNNDGEENNDENNNNEDNDENNNNENNEENISNENNEENNNNNENNEENNNNNENNDMVGSNEKNNNNENIDMVGNNEENNNNNENNENIDLPKNNEDNNIENNKEIINNDNNKDSQKNENKMEEENNL